MSFRFPEIHWPFMKPKAPAPPSSATPENNVDPEIARLAAIKASKDAVDTAAIGGSTLPTAVGLNASMVAEIPGATPAPSSASVESLVAEVNKLVPDVKASAPTDANKPITSGPLKSAA